MTVAKPTQRGFSYLVRMRLSGNVSFSRGNKPRSVCPTYQQISILGLLFQVEMLSRKSNLTNMKVATIFEIVNYFKKNWNTE